MKPICALLVGEWLRTVRDRRFLMLAVLMPISFYLIFVNQQQAAAPIADTQWNAYFMVSMATFGVIGVSVNTLGVRLAAERQSGWVRWLRTTPLSPGGYAAAKIANQLIMSLMIIAAVFATAHFDQHVSLSFERWTEIALWIWVGSIPFSALGVLIGLAGNSAQVLGTLSYIGLSLLGGLWTPIETMPKTMQIIAHWTPTYHYARPAWHLLANRPVHWSDPLVLLAYAFVFWGSAALIQRRLDARPLAG